MMGINIAASALPDADKVPEYQLICAGACGNQPVGDWYAALDQRIPAGCEAKSGYISEVGMQIRRLILDDYDEMYALWMSCAGMGLNNLDDSRDGIDRFLRRNPDTCFAAEADGRLIGVILAGNDGRRGYIYHTAVHPQYRKQGAARRLVEAAMQALEECGINKAALVVFSRNEQGNAFWEKLGFTAREDLVYRNRCIAEMVRIDL